MVLFAIQMESVVVELLVGKLAVFDDFSDLLWSEAEEDIFWFKIGMDDSADSVEEVETHQNLSGDFLHQIKREPLVIVPFENFEQINPQNLKHHTKMISIRPFIQEGVQQVEHMRVIPIKSSLVRFVIMKWIDPLGVVGFIGDFLENLDFIVRGFEIVGRAFHDLDGNVVLVLEVFCEPDGWEVAPAEFLYQDVTVDEDLAHVAGVIAADLVVFNALVLTVVLLVEVGDQLL